ncbi:MAG: protein kinase [Myxococcota bacterium]
MTALAPGERLDRYELLCVLAQGGMGTVWRARHRSGVAAAVKIIPADLTGGADAADALQAEVRAVGTLDHPNIVRVYDAGTLEPDHERGSRGKLRAGSPWLAMELADGSIHDLTPSLDWHKLVHVLVQVLDALGHAHARGIVHRDLKPGNLLYTGGFDQPRIVLADFGLAWRWRGDELVHGGSLPYAAPEQILGLRTEQGPWTDLYALGCATYRLATGHRPFQGDEDEIRRGHLFAPVPHPAVRFPAPPEFADWLRGLMAKDPDDRFQCAADAAWSLVHLPRPAGSGRVRLPDTATLPLTEWAAIPDPPAIPPVAASRVRPPVLPGWSGSRPVRTAALGGRGLGLFGLHEPPLAGRPSERERLWTAVRELDRPRIVVVRGGAGLGKTRLASWLVERASELGAAEAFRARFDRVPAEIDGLPGLIEEHLHSHGMDATELLRELRQQLSAAGDREAYALTRLLRPADPLLDGEPLSGPERLAVVWRVIARRASGRRLVVWLDDAHHAAESVALVEYVADLPSPPPVLFVLTAREERIPHRERLRAVIDRLGGLELDLGPLLPDELSGLVRQMLPLDRAVADRIAAHANGNPRLAVQLVSALVERGGLRGDPGGVELTSSEVLPDSLATLWTAALDRLDEVPGAREALRIAAVLGPTFAHAEWRDAAARLDRPIPTGLSAMLVNRGFLVPERSGGRFSFAHLLLRDRLLIEARADGRRIDVACAEILAGRGEAYAGRAAVHFEEAQAFDRAAEMYLVALRWLSEWDRERALEVASRWYGTLGRIAADTDPRWLEGMQALVDLYAMHGGDAHRRAVEELLERGRATRDHLAEVRALIELARIDLRALALDRAEARSEIAFHRARGTPLHPLATITRAEVKRIRGDTRGAEVMLRGALGGVERGDQAVVLSLARVLCDAGRPTDGLAVLTDWADRQTRAQAPMARARLQRGRGHALVCLDRPTEAVAALDEASRMRQRAGFDWPVLDLDHGCALLAAGRLDAARALLEPLLDRFATGVDVRHRGQLVAALAELAARVDDPRVASRQLEILERLPARGHRRSTIDAIRRVAGWARTAGHDALADRASAWIARAAVS